MEEQRQQTEESDFIDYDELEDFLNSQFDRISDQQIIILNKLDDGIQAIRVMLFVLTAVIVGTIIGFTLSGCVSSSDAPGPCSNDVAPITSTPPIDPSIAPGPPTGPTPPSVPER